MTKTAAAADRRTTRAATRSDRQRAISNGPGDLAVAPLLIALPLASLFTARQAIGFEWLPVTLLVVAALVGIGTLVRLSGSDSLRTRALAWWLQAAALVGILLLREGVVTEWDAGFGWAALLELVQSLGMSIGQGIWNMAWYSSIPFQPSPPTTTVIILVAGVMVLLNDIVLRLVRLPAIAMLWSFLPAGIPMAIQLPMHPLLLAPVAVLLIIALLTCGRRGPSGPTRRTGMTALAATAAVVLALPLVVPDPRTAEWRIPDLFTRTGWFAPISPELNEEIDLASHLSRADPVEVMRYTTSDGQPTYLRLTSLHDTSQGGFTARNVEEWMPSTGPFYNTPAGLPGTPYEFDIESSGFVTDFLPLPNNLISYYPGDARVEGIDYWTRSVLLEDDSRELINGAAWRGTAERPSRDLAPLINESPMPESWRVEEMFPAELEALKPLAQEIAGDAKSEYEMMERLVAWFSTDDWQYSEEIPFAGFGTEPDGQWRALLAFIEERVGYCVHYASAFAALALAMGIEASVAIGFLPGEQQEDGSFSVTTNDMHAWAEVYLAGFGVVTYDVTPPILAGENAASDVRDNPYGPDGTAPTPRPSESESPLPSASASPSPSESATPEASESEEPTDLDDELRPSDDPVPTQGEGSGEGEDTEPAADVTWMFVLLAVVVLLVLPALIRGGRRTLRRREGVVGAWKEVLDTAIDTGLKVPPGATGAQIVLLLRERLPEPLADAASGIRIDAEAAAFGKPGSETKPYGAEQVRDISRALWRELSPVSTAIRHWLPPSLVPKQLRSMQNG